MHVNYKDEDKLNFELQADIFQNQIYWKTTL